MKRYSRKLAGTALALSLLALGAAPGYAREDDEAAQSLKDMLAYTYQHNPTIDAAREGLRAQDESIAQALSGWRPVVTATADHTVQKTEFDGAVGAGIPGFSSDATVNYQTVGIGVTQPLYRGGRTVASTSAAENSIMAQRARLGSIEQGVLLDAVTAYLDVVRDKAVLELRKKNEQVLSRHLEASRERFNVGEVTRTDVSQAESRLSGAKAGRIAAQANINASMARFEQVVGVPAGTLLTPEIKPDLPGSLDEAVEVAVAENPQILAAEYDQLAARDNVDQVTGELLPEVSVSGNFSRSYDPAFSNADEKDVSTFGVNATIPLYQAGSVSSRVRQAKNQASQRRIEIQEVRRQVRQQTISAWEILQAAHAGIVARQAQVESARLALEGVREENQVGARTVLDVLDAEQELLDAQVSLATAKREEGVAVFTLGAALGRLTPENLGFADVAYAPETHYREIRNRWIGLTPPGKEN